MEQGSRSASGVVVSLDQGEWVKRRAAKQVINLVHEARVALDAVLAGDIDMVHTANMLVNRATLIVSRHRFATEWKWRPPA